MELKKISLTNFRNIRSFKDVFSSHINILVGNNGQGKTNLMEAIYLSATAKSFRKAPLAQLIMSGKDKAMIIAEVLKNKLLKDITWEFTEDQRRIVSINGKKIQKISNYIGNINVTLFSPEDLMIVKGDASGRRTFLDILLCQIDPIYLHDLIFYNRIIKQRNFVLKEIHNRKKSSLSLDAWDEQLPNYATKITIKRLILIKKLHELAKNVHKSIVCDENLEVLYISTIPNFEENYLEEYRKSQEALRAKEIARGMTLIGPHRDDINLQINNKDARYFGSQGQQRTVAISLRIAEMEYIREVTGEYPVLLLDDIFSELDEKRKSLLLQVLNRDIQTFLTGTELSDFKPVMEQAKIFRVNRGDITHVRQ